MSIILEQVNYFGHIFLSGHSRHYLNVRILTELKQQFPQKNQKLRDANLHIEIYTKISKNHGFSTRVWGAGVRRKKRVAGKDLRKHSKTWMIS